MMTESSAPNIVFFGAAGSGKSSIINMLYGRQVAAVSSGLGGCTFEAALYPVIIRGTPFNLYDTAGFNEGETGRISNNEAVIQLFQLLRNLKTGVSLLVFCMRGPRIQDVTPKNWRLFYEIICDKKVPILIAITGLENEEPSMDDWWFRNKGSFEKHSMSPNGVACITAVRGNALTSGGYQLDEEYAESRLKMANLLRMYHLKTPWKVQLIEWFSMIIKGKWWWWVFGWSPEKEGIKELVRRCGMTAEEALKLGQMLSKA